MQDSSTAMLTRAWGLAKVPLMTAAYTAAVLEFLEGDSRTISTQRLKMFELAVEIRWMRGTYKDLCAAWMPEDDAPRRRADTLPGFRRVMATRANETNCR